jgi:hypothetical protein
MAYGEQVEPSGSRLEVFEESYWEPISNHHSYTKSFKAPAFSVQERKVFGELLTIAALETVTESAKPSEIPYGAELDVNDFSHGTVLLVDFEEQVLSNTHIDSTLKPDESYPGHLSYMVNCDSLSLLKLGFGKAKGSFVKEINLRLEQSMELPLQYSRSVWFAIVVPGKNENILYSFDAISRDADDPIYQGVIDYSSKLHFKAAIGKSTFAKHKKTNQKTKHINPAYQRLRYAGVYEESSEELADRLNIIRDNNLFKGRVALRHFR